MTAIETPCINVCAIDPASRLCTGCGRTLAEVAGWTAMSPRDRRRIMQDLPGRLAAYLQRRASAANVA